jgi:hypothetical protein
LHIPELKFHLLTPTPGGWKTKIIRPVWVWRLACRRIWRSDFEILAAMFHRARATVEVSGVLFRPL